MTKTQDVIPFPFILASLIIAHKDIILNSTSDIYHYIWQIDSFHYYKSKLLIYDIDDIDWYSRKLAY